jgi:hypothetical protein
MWKILIRYNILSRTFKQANDFYSTINQEAFLSATSLPTDQEVLHSIPGLLPDWEIADIIKEIDTNMLHEE